MARIGPIILSVAGDTFTDGCRVSVIIWNGATTAGHTCRLDLRTEGAKLWGGTAAQANDYLGANFGPKGLHCPTGFKLTQIGSGEVYVYLAED